jgi:hypothetical protein
MARRELIRSSWVLAGLVCWTAGCASGPALSSMPSVGPGPRAPAPPQGYLRVYSVADRVEFGHETFYYPHRNYWVYNAQGKRLVKLVLNHVGVMDQQPATVALPAGSYQVLADDVGYGRLKVPVVVRARRTTVLHLDGGWQPPPQLKGAEVVCLPDGECIGWRADLAEPGSPNSY